MPSKVLASPIGGLKHVQQRINELDLMKVEIGWFASAQHPKYGKVKEDGSQDIIGYIPMATIAAQNEFGNSENGIPPRPFIRPALSENKVSWRDAIKRGARSIILGASTDEKVLNQIGLNVAGTIREYITKVQTPPLKPATVKARLRIRADKETVGLIDKPLVFEGILLNSVTYVVKDGEEKTPFKEGGG